MSDGSIAAMRASFSLATLLAACAPVVGVTGDSGSSSSTGDVVISGGSETSSSESSPPQTGEVESTLDTTASTTATTSDPDTGTAADSSSEGPTSPCGNGRLDDGEVCDDGNVASGDGCNADCQLGGQEIWTAYFDGGSQLDDWGHRVVTDADDDVIVVGMGFGIGETARDGLVVKYDGDEGVVLWDERYDGEQSISTDFFWGVAVTLDQFIVVTGSSTDAMGQQRAMVRMYDEDGNEQWTYFEPNNGNGYANDVVVDSVGDIVVTGFVHDPDTLAPRAWLAKFASDGEPIWNLRLEMPVGNGNVVLARDNSDALIMAGGVGLVYVRKLDTEGNELWTWTDALDGQGGLRGAAIGSGDDIFVAGGHLMGPTNSYLARVPSNGDDPLWIDSWAGKLGGSAYGAAVAVDTADHVVMAGNHFGNNQQGIIVRKYAADGELAWLHEIDGTPNGIDFPFGVATDAQDDVFVSGRRPGADGSYDIFVRKLTR